MSGYNFDPSQYTGVLGGSSSGSSGGFWNTVGNYASGFAQWMNSNEWAANAMMGAGYGALKYKEMKEAQKLAERQNAWTNERYYAKAPGDAKNYDSHLPLAAGNLTNGGLLNKGPK